MMKRCLSLCLVVGLIVALAVPVSADEGNAGGWIEFLETTSVQTNGENWFTLNGQTGSFTLPLHTEKRLVSVDMLIWHQTAERITKATVTTNGTTATLTVVHLGSGISRIYGDIPNAYYDEITVTLTHNTSSTVTYELLSFKATPLAVLDYNADAQFYYNYSFSPCPGLLEVAAKGGDYENTWEQFAVVVRDWEKYDQIAICLSATYFPVNSVRAVIGATGVPFEITYTTPITSGSTNTSIAEGYYSGYSADGLEEGTFEFANEEWSIETYRTKSLYFLTLDLSGIDRNTSDPLYVHFTGISNSNYGFLIQCTGVTGSVFLADTSSVTWWRRFTSFMGDRFTALANSISSGFSNVGTWIGNQTAALKTELVGIWQETEEGFANLGVWISNQTAALKTELIGIWGEIEDGFTNVGSWFERYFGVKDQEPIDDLESSSDSISDNTSQIHDFEQSQQAVLDNNFAQIQSAITFTNFAAALVFVQKYTNMTFNGISQYAIIFTLPLFLGLFFYLCSRVPGITRWKTPPPRSKGGGKT